MRFLSRQPRAALTALTVLTLLPQAKAFFRLPCAKPLVVERLDPIINPGQVSSHVHTVMGGSAFGPNTSYAQARAATCSTCAVTADLSNYWTPSLYYHSPNGSFVPVGQTAGMLVYYLQRRANASEPLHAFPEGFRMIAGDPSLRSYNASALEQRAISFMCLGGPAAATPALPAQNCPDGLRFQVVFPSCWDGVNVDSASHKSHVAYPDGVDSGACPASHPVRLVTIFYEVVWQVDAFAAEAWSNKTSGSAPFVLSSGDPTGFGLHGDFLNGWDVPTLQRAVDTCTDESGVIEKCPVFDFFPDATMDGCGVPPVVDEPVTGALAGLPGCNPIQSGPARAEDHSGCGAPTGLSAPRWPYTDVTRSLGYRYLGCGTDSSSGSRTLAGATKAGDDMTIDVCVAFCKAGGFSIAGLEYGRECYCGNSVADDRKPAKGLLGTCNYPCAGNGTEFCGGRAVISLYQQCAGATSCENVNLLGGGT